MIETFPSLLTFYSRYKFTEFQFRIFNFDGILFTPRCYKKGVFFHPEKSHALKQSLSTTSNMDCQLLRQKIRQKISGLKTNSGVFVVFKTKRESKCQDELETQSVCFHYWDFPMNFLKFDVIKRLCLSKWQKWFNS